MDACIVVRGFGDSLLKLNGQYEKGADNCGKPTYKKDSVSCIYYWDKDDDMRGWWIAPSVNGDEVWARNPSGSNLPPRSGWFAPWEAKIPNKLVSLSFVAEKKRPMPTSFPGRAAPAKKLKTDEELQEMLTTICESVSEVDTSIAECVVLVDKLKDIAVMFTCEVVDHMPPDDVLSMKKKADEVGKEAQIELGKSRKVLDGLRGQVEQCRQSLGTGSTLGTTLLFTETKTKADTLTKKLHELTREVTKNLGDVSRGSQKAANMKRAELQAEAQKSQRLAVQKVTAFQIIIKPMKAGLKEMKSVKEIRDAESIVLAMLDVVAKELPTCTGNFHNILRNTAVPLKPFLKQLQDKRKDIHLAEAAKVDELGSILGRAIQEYMEKEGLSEEATFARVAQTESQMTGAHLEAFVDTLSLGEISKELLSSLFGRALVAASTGCEKEKETLSKDDFFMYVARSLYSTLSEAVLELEEGDAKKTIKLEDGDIVEVIEGPVGEPLKAKVKLMDGKTGWTLFKFLQRMSPQFTVVQETVLTDRHELKGFSVVQRLRPGTKVLATKLPAVDPTTKLLRVPVTIIGENLSGYVTVKGNRGAQLLKQDAAAPEDFGSSAVTAKELGDEDWVKMVADHTTTVTTDLRSKLEDITSRKEDCEKKCVTLEALADGWTEEVLEETSKAAVEAWEKIDSLNLELAAKLAVQTRELANVSADVPGPLSEVKATVDEVGKKLQEAKQAHAETTKRARQLHKKLTGELQLQNRKKELAKEEEFVNGRIDESIGRQELVIGMVSRLSVTPTDEAGLLTLQDTIAEGEEMVTTLRAWTDETRKECQTKHAKKTELGKSLGELSSNLSKLNTHLTAQKTKLAQIWVEMVDKGAISVAKALRDHMEMNQMSEEALFAELATDGLLTLPSLVQFLAKLKLDLSASIIEKIFNKLAPKESEHISAHRFAFLTTCYYKVVKATTLTDSLSIKAGNRISALKVDDSVTLLGQMEVDESTGVTRVRVAHDGKEGYVTVRGNQGTVFLEAQSFYYKVTKDTVITDKFDMQNFQVVRRLKIGDILRARSLPKEEKQSGLWRLEVVALLPKAAAASASAAEHSGFVTMKGNQGTAFLESINIEGADLEEPCAAATVAAAEVPAEPVPEVTEKPVVDTVMD